MMFENIPPTIASAFANMNDIQMGMAMILGYLFAPMFLIVPNVFHQHQC